MNGKRVISLLMLVVLVLLASACQGNATVSLDYVAVRDNPSWNPASDYSEKYTEVRATGSQYDGTTFRHLPITVVQPQYVAILKYAPYTVFTAGRYNVPAEDVHFYPTGMVQFRTLHEEGVTDPTACESLVCQTPLTDPVLANGRRLDFINVDVIFAFMLDEADIERINAGRVVVPELTENRSNLAAVQEAEEINRRYDQSLGRARKLIELGTPEEIVRQYIAQPLRGARAVTDGISLTESQTQAGWTKIAEAYRTVLRRATEGIPLSVIDVRIRAVQLTTEDANLMQAQHSAQAQVELNATLTAIENETRAAQMAADHQLRTEEQEFENRLRIEDAETTSRALSTILQTVDEYGEVSPLVVQSALRTLEQQYMQQQED